MTTLVELYTQIPHSLFECIAVAPPCKCIVALLNTRIPSCLLSWNTQFLNVADVNLPFTMAPYLLFANSQRVATTVVVAVVVIGIRDIQNITFKEMTVTNGIVYGYGIRVSNAKT